MKYRCCKKKRKNINNYKKNMNLIICNLMNGKKIIKKNYMIQLSNYKKKIIKILNKIIK